MGPPVWVVDAFTAEPFAGNPAAVCLLDRPRDDAWMQRVAAEMRHSETAFLLREGAAWRLRWFTPKVEVDLCGHATLASAYVLFERRGHPGDAITFETRKSGTLVVRRRGDLLEMDFPTWPLEPVDPPPALLRGLGARPLEVLGSEDWLAVYATEKEVRALDPDLGALATLHRRGVIVTAPGTASDFVSRCFYPSYGIPEDPVTGSAHCALTPYWSKRLGKRKLYALQVSRRGGELLCEDRGDRVAIAGRVAAYLEGTITV
jgi:predicted PhzF superfamily epimerase YddE/YHI9